MHLSAYLPLVKVNAWLNDFKHTQMPPIKNNRLLTTACFVPRMQSNTAAVGLMLCGRTRGQLCCSSVCFLVFIFRASARSACVAHGRVSFEHRSLTRHPLQIAFWFSRRRQSCIQVCAALPYYLVPDSPRGEPPEHETPLGEQIIPEERPASLSDRYGLLQLDVLAVML